jgi:hypothetical protein
MEKGKKIKILLSQPRFIYENTKEIILRNKDRSKKLQNWGNQGIIEKEAFLYREKIIIEKGGGRDLELFYNIIRGKGELLFYRDWYNIVSVKNGKEVFVLDIGKNDFMCDFAEISFNFGKEFNFDIIPFKENLYIYDCLFCNFKNREPIIKINTIYSKLFDISYNVVFYHEAFKAVKATIIHLLKKVKKFIFGGELNYQQKKIISQYESNDILNEFVCVELKDYKNIGEIGKGYLFSCVLPKKELYELEININYDDIIRVSDIERHFFDFHSWLELYIFEEPILKIPVNKLTTKKIKVTIYSFISFIVVFTDENNEVLFVKYFFIKKINYNYEAPVGTAKGVIQKVWNLILGGARLFLNVVGYNWKNILPDKWETEYNKSIYEDMDEFIFKAMNIPFISLKHKYDYTQYTDYINELEKQKDKGFLNYNCISKIDKSGYYKLSENYFNKDYINNSFINDWKKNKWYFLIEDDIKNIE